MKKTKAVVSTALASGLTSTAGAATVQITLTGNMISTLGGNQLVADLTGDTLADVTFSRFRSRTDYVGVNINAGAVYAYASGTEFYVDAAFARPGVGRASVTGTSSPQNINFLNPIIFTDARINGGMSTQGWLQVNAFNSSFTNHTVALTRLIFDDASTTRPAYASIPGPETEWSAVPEPSSFALLTLGAGGLLLRRRRKAAVA